MPNTGAQNPEYMDMEQTTNNQETADERYRKMAEADLRRAVDMCRFLDRVFGTITNPKISADKDINLEVRMSER